ncbi:7523_t:CDS:2 [Acaulospora morrowiae]|uniref:7523_t:CDS:1 n=1 Tax=Acaulospora morrowiae TaxID=94023 RepID=A0A9N9AJR1_9GLOM|nr:7523_t:CDS:2 [Acaulospora morrowiae]
MTEGGVGNAPLETTVGKLLQIIQELVAKFATLESAPRKRNGTEARNPQIHRDEQPATQTEACFGELISNEEEEEAFIRGGNRNNRCNTNGQRSATSNGWETKQHTAKSSTQKERTIKD